MVFDCVHNSYQWYGIVLPRYSVNHLRTLYKLESIADMFILAPSFLSTNTKRNERRHTRGCKEEDEVNKRKKAAVCVCKNVANTLEVDRKSLRNYQHFIPALVDVNKLHMLVCKLTKQNGYAFNLYTIPKATSKDKLFQQRR